MKHRIPKWAMGLLLLSFQPVSCSQPRSGGVSADVLIELVEAEDLRRWDDAGFRKLLTHPDGAVRERAALAAGRIGDADAVPQLIGLLTSDASESVAAMAAFALGEIESASGADALMSALDGSRPASISARAVEALGKIVAGLPEAQSEPRQRFGQAILEVLRRQAGASTPDRETTILALTAALRAKPEDAATVITAFLESSDPRVRADALNALARLQAKESIDRIRTMLADDPEPIVRANAARVLGAAKDTGAIEALAARVFTDTDPRVRASAIRALGALKQRQAAGVLSRRGSELHDALIKAKGGSSLVPPQVNEILEIATALGNSLGGSDDPDALTFLTKIRTGGIVEPETEIAFALISPARYLNDSLLNNRALQPIDASSFIQGLGAIASAPPFRAEALAQLQSLIQDPKTPVLALPDALHALADFAPADLAETARRHLQAQDVVLRTAAAEILLELPPSVETTRALAAALPAALQDEMNDAALAIVGALGRSQDAEASEALRQALKDEDHLVRRRAVDALKDRPGVETPAIGSVTTRNARADYERAAGRIGKSVKAKITTDKGEIEIELLPGSAPLTVDSFVTLASGGFFDGLTFHRVVPNFVIQGGDPRGDGSGGPGYQIRCEINTVAFERGVVGMALSGKDTGGSQFFITHSPQPHLDGGYTVFGRVTSGMNAVDAIARGDRIRMVTVE